MWVKRQGDNGFNEGGNVKGIGKRVKGGESRHTVEKEDKYCLWCGRGSDF